MSGVELKIEREEDPSRREPKKIVSVHVDPRGVSIESDGGMYGEVGCVTFERDQFEALAAFLRRAADTIDTLGGFK